MSRLLVRLGSMGDVILATAAATAWLNKSGEPVDFLVKEEWSPLLANHPAIRRVIPLKDEDRGTAGLRRLAERLRENQYEEAVDLQGSTRSRSLIRLAGIPSVRRASRASLRRKLLVHFHRFGPPPSHRVVDTFVHAVDPFATATPSVVPGADIEAEAERFLGPGAPVVALVPGAKHMTKRWPVQNFIALGRTLAEKHRVLVFFGPGEDELEKTWRSEWPEGWVGVREPLAMVGGLLKASSVTVTGDTGLMHLSAAVGTPVVALFGPTVEAFGFFPSGPNHEIIERSLACRPCSLHGGSRCPKEHFRCMRDISHQDVWNAVQRRLGPKPKESRHTSSASRR